MLQTNKVGDFADWWADLVAELDSYGCRPGYIDLMNEPDSGGGWSTGISPENYNTLVKLTRAELNSRGFTDVGIVGPGVTNLNWDNHNSEWINALDSNGVASLACWASHAWDDGDLCSGGALCLENNWPDFGDSADAQDANKAKWITEYATKEDTFHGVTYPRPDDTGGYSAAHTMSYAVRVYENTLAHLNSGANVLFYWHAEDKGKSWGYVDASGNLKPVFYTLKNLYPKIPVGASVVSAPEQSANFMYAGAFVYGSKIIVGIANDSNSEHSSTIHLQNAPANLSIIEAVAVEQTYWGDPNLEEPDVAVEVDKDLSLISGGAGEYSFDVTLAADSTLTVTLALVGDMTGEGVVDFDDLAVVVGEWLKSGCGVCNGADLSGDGRVDLEDFGGLAANWLAGM